MSTRIHIFCDGGIGNRINALISGLALSHRFDIASTIYWPMNSWCGAPFSDIFQNDLDIQIDPLDALSGKFGHAKMLLHDEIGAQFLKVPFDSAYDYQSLEDFERRGLPSSGDLFFYPAIIPQWIPDKLIHESLRRMRFSVRISQSVSEFINQTMKRPFHGLHLRRTDLRVGLTDHEAMALVQRYPQEAFFVCSDDPYAEAVASAHPNVHARSKSFYVEKKEPQSDWVSPSKDQEGRTYYGNIKRSREAIIEGTIDMLVLAHSQIVGFSGSTFQRMAKLIGNVAPLVPIARPNALPFFSFTEMTQQVERQLIDHNVLLQVCQNMIQNGEAGQALELMRMGYERMTDAQRPDIAHNLGVILLNQNQPRQACLYFIAALQIQNLRHSSWLHLAYAKSLIAEHDQAKQALQQAVACRLPTVPPSDALLEKALAERYQLPSPPAAVPKDAP